MPWHHLPLFVTAAHEIVTVLWITNHFVVTAVHENVTALWITNQGGLIAGDKYRQLMLPPYGRKTFDEESVDGLYISRLALYNVTDEDGGLYICVVPSLGAQLHTVTIYSKWLVLREHPFNKFQFHKSSWTPNQY